MIRPPDLRGVVFSEGSEGDIKHDEAARLRLMQMAGAPLEWASVRQVHGNLVIRVDQPGEAGAADALWTSKPGLTLSVFTADCFAVAMVAPGAVGLAHAGWRGASGGVVRRLRGEMAEAGHAPVTAAVGPGIGPCCFEVGEEVLAEFPGVEAKTRWGTDSVDLGASVRAQLEGIDIWVADGCTYHDEGLLSHRADGTSQRLAALGWIA